MLSLMKMLLKGEIGGHALNSHGNYIVDHGKVMESCFLIFVGTLYNRQSAVDNLMHFGLVQYYVFHSTEG